MQPLWRAGLYGAALAAVWVTVAWFYDTTFHLAPLLVAAVVPLGASLTGERPPPRRLAVTIGAVALAATAAGLGGTPPGLAVRRGAPAESVAFAGGASSACRWRSRRRGGSVLPDHIHRN
jgi:hypothetical protein